MIFVVLYAVNVIDKVKDHSIQPFTLTDLLSVPLMAYMYLLFIFYLYIFVY